MTALPTDFQDNVGDEVTAAWHNLVGTNVNANTDAIAALAVAPYGGDLPPSSDWTNVSVSGGNTIEEDNGHQLATIAGSSSINAACRVRTLSPTSNYAAEFIIDPIYPTMAGSTRWMYGPVLRESSTGKLVTFSLGDVSSSAAVPALNVTAWSSPTAQVVHYHNAAAPDPRPCGFRIRDDGTNRIFELSYNGLDWSPAPVLTQSRTTHITPNQIGFFVWNNLVTEPMKVRLRSFRIVSTA